MGHPWTYGQTVKASEYVAVCARLFGRKRPSMPPERVLIGIHKVAPLRLDFEINRLRGFGFDPGECGFAAEVLK